MENSKNKVFTPFLCLFCGHKWIYEKRTIGENCAIGKINKCPKCTSDRMIRIPFKKEDYER